MSKRTDQREHDSEPGRADPERFGADLGLGTESESGATGPENRTTTGQEAGVTGRLRARLASPFSGLFSVRLFLLVTFAAFATMVLAGLFVPLGGLAGYLGIGVVGFLVGAAADGRQYLELLVGGAASSAVGTVVGNVVLAGLGVGLPLAVIGATGGAVAGVVGHYLGRDLRDGLTREL